MMMLARVPVYSCHTHVIHTALAVYNTTMPLVLYYTVHLNFKCLWLLFIYRVVVRVRVHVLGLSTGALVLGGAACELRRIWRVSVHNSFICALDGGRRWGKVVAITAPDRTTCSRMLLCLSVPLQTTQRRRRVKSMCFADIDRSSIRRRFDYERASN